MPSGCGSIEDIPVDLFRAIQHAERIVSWQENLMDDEMPPRWMWPFEEKLSSWFEDVKSKRNGGESNSDSGENPSMIGNEFAQRFK